jgi:hypothetical protein
MTNIFLLSVSAPIEANGFQFHVQGLDMFKKLVSFVIDDQTTVNSRSTSIATYRQKFED